MTAQKFLDSSKLKEFAEDNFKFDENGRKLSKQVQNIVGKGEIARYEQFLLFPQCFQKDCLPEGSKGVIVWEWVNGDSSAKEGLKCSTWREAGAVRVIKSNAHILQNSPPQNSHRSKNCAFCFLKR